MIDAVRQVATRADASSSSRSLEKDVLEFIRFLQDAKLQLLNEKGQVETKLAVATRAGDVAERHAQQLVRILGHGKPVALIPCCHCIAWAQVTGDRCIEYAPFLCRAVGVMVVASGLCRRGSC